MDTLVILMGMRNLTGLVDQLLVGGKDPKTPAAAIMNGTLGRQRVVGAALAELPAAVEAATLGAPSVVVIGEVVALRESLSWWEKEPLFGMRVLVTRAAEQAHDLASELRTAGAEPVLVPMIELVAPTDKAANAALAAVMTRLQDFDGLVFASSNGVRFFAESVRGHGRELGEINAQVFCVGQQTAQAALDVGLPVHLVATGRSDAEGLLAQIVSAVEPAGRRFLVPRSDIGRTVIADGLRAAGADVESVVAYQNVQPAVDAAALCADLVRGNLPILTFTSPSTVDNFVALLDAPARQSVDNCVVAAVGATTARALRACGIEPTVISPSPDAQSLVRALVDHLIATASGAPAVERRSGR